MKKVRCQKKNRETGLIFEIEVGWRCTCRNGTVPMVQSRNKGKRPKANWRTSRNEHDNGKREGERVEGNEGIRRLQLARVSYLPAGEQFSNGRPSLSRSARSRDLRWSMNRRTYTRQPRLSFGYLSLLLRKATARRDPPVPAYRDRSINSLSKYRASHVWSLNSRRNKKEKAAAMADKTCPKGSTAVAAIASSFTFFTWNPKNKNLPNVMIICLAEVSLNKKF